MIAENRDYIRYRAGQAREALQDAEHLLRAGSLRATVNRLYYACFYAVCGLLLTEERYSSKHSGVASMFARYWVGPGLFPIEMGRFYRRLLKYRHQGDYAYETVFDPDEVRTWFAEATDFVTRALDIIRERNKEVSSDMGETYTSEQKAAFLLSGAVDAADYAAAVKEVREMGLDPEAIPHSKPPDARPSD